MKPRVFAILYKEFIHILRDPRSLILVFLWPLLMILLYGYAITFDIKHIGIGVLDQDHTPRSRQLIQKLTSSDYFQVTQFLSSRKQIEDGFKRQTFRLVLIIPPRFHEDLFGKEKTEVQLIVDGSDANTATIAINYLKMFFLLYSLEQQSQIGFQPVEIAPRVWYNPELKSSHFIVPGLVAIILMMVCTLLTSVTIARERETGTIEQILVSPIHAGEMVVGKVLPYILLSFLDALLVMVFSIFVFGVPFRGNPVIFLLGILAFEYVALSLGVLVSIRAKTQQVAMITAMVTTFLPTFLLSGFIFPIASFPKVLRIISIFVPARYFLLIVRGVMLKGVGWPVLWKPFLILLFFGIVLMGISIKRFKLHLE